MNHSGKHTKGNRACSGPHARAGGKSRILLLQERYAGLVDKEFRKCLSEQERRELAKLEQVLDRIESLDYAPIKRLLAAVRDELAEGRKTPV